MGPDKPTRAKTRTDRSSKSLAGIGPGDIDVAEVHDATSFCDIFQVEMLGFCPLGEGGKFIESGVTGLEKV